ncbi:MAG TPA: MarR family transcriptional regulator [Bacteroidia bacterium]|nr:MarR family transcriptional regulator [Bacteroidia bacterium]
MELQQAREKFYQTWGTMGTNWGINRTMAQIHAFLLVSEEPVTTEEIMEELLISRGNANINIRTLIDWGLVQRELKAGERKEYFTAEKDMWTISRRIARERRKKELEPALQAIDELRSIKDNTPEGKKFRSRMSDIHSTASTVDSLLQRFINSNDNWIVKMIAYLIK